MSGTPYFFWFLDFRVFWVFWFFFETLGVLRIILVYRSLCYDVLWRVRRTALLSKCLFCLCSFARAVIFWSMQFL